MPQVEWQSIKVMQELGHGAFGAVFLARYNLGWCSRGAEGRGVLAN